MYFGLDKNKNQRNKGRDTPVQFREYETQSVEEPAVPSNQYTPDYDQYTPNYLGSGNAWDMQGTSYGDEEGIPQEELDEAWKWWARRGRGRRGRFRPFNPLSRRRSLPYGNEQIYGDLSNKERAHKEWMRQKEKYGYARGSRGGK